MKRGGAAIIYCRPSRQAFAFFKRDKYYLENLTDARTGTPKRWFTRLFIVTTVNILKLV